MDGQRTAKITAITIFLIAGTVSTFAYKLMESQYVDEGGVHRKFFHPYMQSFSLFFGQSFCLILYYSNRKKNQLPLQPGKKPHQFYYFLIPALSDAFSSVLQYMGLNFISGSTYLMFKGSTIVTTALFSKILFGMVIQKRHYLGCGAAVLGLIIVGGSGFLEQSKGSNDFGTQILGYILMLVSLIFNGFLYAYEQFLIRKHTIHPIQMVGCEGFFGLLILTFITLVLSIIPCNFQQKLCVNDSYGHPYFERIDQFFEQVFNSFILAVLVVVGMITITAYKLNGVRITKLIDALTRALLNIIKTGIVWAVGIVITFSVGDNPDYQLESKQLLVNAVKGIGFLFIVLGTLIYNRLIFKRYLGQSDQLASSKAENNISLLSEKDEVSTNT